MNRNMIYSKRFEKEPLMQDLEKPNSQPLGEEEAARMQESFRKFCESITYVPRPEKQAMKENFVALSIELSKAYDVDADVYEGADFVATDLYLNCASFMGELKGMFAKLFGLCDDFQLFRPKDGAHDIIVSFTLYTHDRYLNGKRIGPIE